MADLDQLDRLTDLRRYSKDGRRAPHKPLLVLLALGEKSRTGSSTLRWESARERLAELIRDFGPPSSTSSPQSAAYPFTRLRSDGVWLLSDDVPMDRVGPLDDLGVTGRFEAAIERALEDSALLRAAARAIVTAEFPQSIADDVLVAVGLDPDDVLAGGVPPARRRSSAWPRLVLQAWDRQCAFCGFDGQLGDASVGLEAAHVRWFQYEGPDELDNGLALCALHHKLFDRGALGLDDDLRIVVAETFTARTDAGKAVYDLHGRPLAPRSSTPLPHTDHVAWHRTQVFSGRVA